MAPPLLRWLLLAAGTAPCLGSAIVTDVTPRHIGWRGGAVTIHGSGFSEDVFNQFDPVLGNKVWFANEFVSVPCQNPINFNFLLENPQDPSTTKIVCDLPGREGLKGSNWFKLILKVDGNEVSNHKSIEYREDHTPEIREVIPQYGAPGDLVTIKGRMFTKEYGNVNFGDEGSVEGRREESILGMLFGMTPCELTDELGNMYNLTLNGPDSNDGSLTCKPQGTAIGPLTGTMYVSGKYGKSRVRDAYSINSKGQLFLYHTLPVVSSVSPNTGGSAGGTHVTLQGNSFNAYPNTTKVTIGSSPCNIVSVSNYELTCTTPSEADLTDTSLGPRGLLLEVWSGTEADVLDTSTLDTSAADYSAQPWDSGHVTFNETAGFTGRLSGYFSAPYTGNVSFYLRARGPSALYISPDMDPANKEQIIHHEDTSNNIDKGRYHSRQVAMVKDQLYYIEAVNAVPASNEEVAAMRISLWLHKTKHHYKQTKLADDALQTVIWKYGREFETQRVTFNGMENANGSLVRFEHQGLKAKADLDFLDDKKWNDQFTDMFTYTCTWKAKRFGMRQTFEDPDFRFPGAGNTGHHRRANMQAYCGNYAFRNHERVFHAYHHRDKNIDAIRNPYFCFAAKGASYRGKVQVLFRWKDKRGRGRRDWITTPNVWEPKEDEWSHQCFHFEDNARNPNTSWIANEMHEKSYLEVQDIILQRGTVVGDYWMDEIAIGPEDVSQGHERLAPALQNTADVMVNTTEVSPLNDTIGFDLTIKPWTCNHEENDFDLVGIHGADIVGLDTSSMTPQEAYEARRQYLSTEDTVTFTHEQWFGGTVTVERLVRGTRAISGNLTLSFEGKSVVLPTNLNYKNIRPALEGFGMVGVQTYEDRNHDRCFDRRILIDFKTSLAGDVPMIELNTTGMTVPNGDLKKQFEIHRWRRGGAQVKIPGGDFFRMPVTAPTISVSVDGFMANCAAADCTFTHDSSLTPSLSSVSSAVVAGAVELTISGSGFTTDISDFIVNVGSLNCEVFSASSTEISCALEPGPAMVYDISVVVKSKGLATQATQLTHEIQLEIFSNSPSAGSLGGGTTITVIGSGFPATLDGWEGGSVVIDGAQCKVVTTSYSEFECITAAKPSTLRHRRSAGIEISLGSFSASGGSFFYDASLTPEVSSLSPTQSSPLGGEVLTINGSALGALWGQVFLGDKECTIIGWFPSYITCVLPSNTHGVYPVHVAVPGNGYADVSSVPGVTYDFVVTDMTPRKGSTLGGTKIKLSGSGFGDCSNIEVKFGDRLTCKIEECSNTEITCLTQRKGKVVQINNGGKHPIYGPGYVWSNQELEINPGDTVDWKWTLTVNSGETGISVHQVDGPTTHDYNGKGFKSEKLPKGRLQHKFDTPGTYYYSSQPVFGAELFMPGSINVQADQEDSTVSLSVHMEDVPAVQQVVADTGSISVANCTLTGSSDCIADPSSDDSFLFTMAVCLTPIVNSVELTAGAANFSALPIEGYNGAELTIMGEGFSDNSCQNVINVGDNHQCVIQSASANQLICTVDGSGETPLPSLKPQRISVTVINSGSALMAVSDPDTAVFHLIPNIQATNAANNVPDSSSSSGGSSGGSSTGSGNSNSVPPDSAFCDISSDHTMCKWSGASDECSAKTTAREFTEEGKQIILDKHNELRRRVAKGEEPNQPEASNMRALVWNEELAAVAQRWADQCTFGHDSERKKADGTYVGQNAYIGMSSQTSDQATMMAAMGGSAQAWYDEVTDPGFDAANIKPYTFSSGTGHYTQVVWAETEELGCGWSYYEEDGWQKSLVVCNYAVGGNMISASMYEQGAACSACPAGYSCDDGLCVADQVQADGDLQVESDGIVPPDGGSWAGGYLYVISGYGLSPFGGRDTVRVTFGEPGYSMGCTIVDVAFDYISCLVPDFTSYKGDATRKVVPVTVNLGYDQKEPVKELDQLTYTYDDALTASADSMTPTQITTSEAITVGGSNFGSGVRVFLRDKDAPKSRRRRSLPDLPLPYPHEIQKREIHEFWTRFSAKEEPSWRCLHGTSCNHEDVSFMPSDLDRKKRELPEDWEELQDMEKEDDESLLDEICLTDAQRCSEMIAELEQAWGRQKRSVEEEAEESHVRTKRAADEAALLEMALLTEGTYEATVTSATATALTFTPPALPAGQYDVIINVEGQGNSLSNTGRLTSQMNVASISPDTGSIHGGQKITISGSGFCETEGSTSVEIGGQPCTVLLAVPDMVQCTTPAGSDGSPSLRVKSCKAQATSSAFSFAAASSPGVASVSPASASGATSLDITGTNFGTTPSVKVGKTSCVVIGVPTDTSITCELPGIPGGDYPVVVHNPLLGVSDNMTSFTSTLEINSISPSSGSFGGGSPLVISGTGFDTVNHPKVLVCGGRCDIQDISTSQINCLSPTNNATGATEVCDVIVKQDSGTASSAGAFTYDQALTPSIASIDPVRGGTGGGTKITIQGTGFAAEKNKVMIDGSICDVASESSTEIVCYTNYHAGAIKAPVVVDVPDQGYAIYSDPDAATFYYIDRWSSIWTWGGLGTPLKDEFIVITEGQTILLDVSTPVLAFLLIKGGTLMFDSENTFIELQSKYILLVEGGRLQIGSEDVPYPPESKAIITMHGNVRCTEMPVFGCKCIGVRNGTLDFHGEYRDVTWTHLAATASKGDTEIVLKQPVDWRVGDHIAIATTSDRNSMKENEEHYIAAISADGYTVTLEKPLEYKHISIEQTFGDRVIETRGEVGLLTRNILIRGTKNEQFVEVLPACEEDFDSGVAFGDALQTCFAGKFGEELGHDEMGSVIIISPKYRSQGLVAARIEYVEFENAGQAFRVGRYPIHFHLPGNMNTSYVRGNAVHHSNNRACTLHGVDNMVVERNVVFNVKGLSFFLEDGIELNNTLQYNLAIFTRMSNSLLNPDINPASFWVVNAWNRYRHNACAGGTHHCYWLRPAKFPDGPSWTMKYCPNKVPFLEFTNNTAHSMGWYGFWIFGQSNHATYDPHDGDFEHGFCNGKRIQTTVGSFTTWNNKRGVEVVSGANIRWVDHVHMDHDFAGFEIFTSKGPYGDDGPGITNALLVGHSEISEITEKGNKSCTPGGIHMTPTGYNVKDTSFYNFDRGCYAMRMRYEEAGSTVDAGRLEGLVFDNVPHKVLLPGGHDNQALTMKDVDGSLTGKAGNLLVGNSGLNPPECVPDASGELGQSGALGGHQGAVCPETTTFHRMFMGAANAPSSLKYNSLTVTNDYGSSSRPWQAMDLNWAVLLPEGTVNWMSYDTAEHVTNISYTGTLSGMHEGEGNHVLVGHKFYQLPDRFNVLAGQTATNGTAALDAPPTYDTAMSGEWYMDVNPETNKTDMIYIVSDKGPRDGGGGWGRKKRGAVAVPGTYASDDIAKLDFKVFRCFYSDCLPPPPPTLPAGRPLDFKKWSDQSAWLELGYNKPRTGDDVFIPPGTWFVIDEDVPFLNRIYLYGGLEVEDTADRKLEVGIFLIQGGRFQVGLPKAPFQHNFELVLHGNHMTEDQPLPGVNLGAKALGVFGFADMIGKDVGTTWAKLAATAAAGSKTLTLTSPVTWAAGSEVVVSSTSMELQETERMTIASVSGSTITLTSALQFDHKSHEATLSDGQKFKMQGEVGLLTRNVKIVGNDYAEIEDEQFGARVLVGSFEQEDILYTGYARFENVEFLRGGQDGWYDNFDPRYALAYLETGDSESAGGKAGAMESYVKKCAFNYGYNSAIGVFASNNIPVEDNVIYRFINNGIFDEGEGNTIKNNLVTKGESVARIKDQAGNIEFFAGINIKRATKTIMTDNVAAGCAQGGYITRGSPSDEDYLWSNNEAHGNQHGVHVNSRSQSRVPSGVVVVKDFYTWMNYDYAVYVLNEDSIEISEITSLDNGVGLLTHIVGPSADSHKFEEKYVSFTDSVVVSVSDVYDCSKEVDQWGKPVKLDIHKNMMEKKRKFFGKGNWIHNNRKTHHTGVVWPIFQSKFPKEKFPWHTGVQGAAGSNPAMRGIMQLSNVVFANFKENCNAQDLVFRTNVHEDDVNWPINATAITFLDTENDNKLFMDLPLAGKISPSDCSDFDCDGFKKSIILDHDGSIAEDGVQGTIIPDSAYEWDGNPAKGLGYYRVPKPMVTELNGDKIEYVDKMPNTGLYRDSTCQWNDNWRAYKCQEINHRFVIIESMDRDTKIRRLSPIAMLADAGPNGYIDLVNGPQDHSCCSGYICAERLSTFFTMVATGREYEVMFTSIPPQKFRLHMLYNDGGEAVRLKIWFPKQQRLDIYVNGLFMNPNNLDFSADDYNLLPPDPAVHVPALTEPNGANFFDPGSGHLYVIVKGPAVVDVKTQPIVVLKLGMTVDIENFFEEDVVNNLAGLLGIDPKNIRITNIVREGSTGRKKRSGDTLDELVVEIGPPPTTTIGNFVPPPEQTTAAPLAPGETTTTENPAYTTTAGTTEATTAWVAPAGHMDFDQLALVTATISTKFQTGTLGAELGMNVSGMALERPLPPPPAPPPLPPPELRSSTDGVPFAEAALANDTALLEEMEFKTLAVPGGVQIARQPDKIEEMKTMTVRPGVYVTDTDGKAITVLGDAADPWLCTATIASGPAGAKLVGNTTVPFVDGIAQFGEMVIDKAGDDYILEFSVTYPTDTSLPTVQSMPFSVAPRPLGLRFDANSEPPLRKENSTFKVVAEIWDEALDEMASSSVLSSFTWQCTISLLKGVGNLTGTTEVTVKAGRSKAGFMDLSLDTPGVNFELKVDCYSVEATMTVMAVSLPFHVHSYPDTGLLRRTTTGFKFSGLFSQVEALVDAYNNGLVTALTCDGCPPGSLVAADQDNRMEGMMDSMRGDHLDQPAGPSIGSDWQPCQYPEFISGDSCPM